jgi:hypothetical protein
VSVSTHTRTWHLRGTYLEVCNCEAICPCRRIDGKPGGRSSYGECRGALSWLIVDGAIGDDDLSSLGVVLVLWYSDDEPGAPWSWVLHIDERADSVQRDALEDIFTGRLGGTPLSQCPWVFNPSNLLGIVTSRIEIDHTPGRGWFRAGSEVNVRISGPVATTSTITCRMPGHDRAGRELTADLMEVDDERLRFSYSGRCGYESTFDYSSG